METQALEEQARKISSLLASYEKLGAEAEKAKRLSEIAEEHRTAMVKHVAFVEEKLRVTEQGLCEMTQREQDLRIELTEALLWKEMCLARLGSTREASDKQLDLLYGYARQMGSVGHRAITFVTKHVKFEWLSAECEEFVIWLRH